MLLVHKDIEHICISQNWIITQEPVWVKVFVNKTSHYIKVGIDHRSFKFDPYITSNPLKSKIS